MNPILVEAHRGNAVESAHRGALAVVDADGGVVLALGDIERPIFPRSAVKVLQALPLVASGAADALAAERRGTGAGLRLAQRRAGARGHRRRHAGQGRRGRAACWSAARTGPTARPSSARWPRAARRPARCTTTARASMPASSAWPACMADGGRPTCAASCAGYVRAEHPVMREVTAALQAATGWDLAQRAAGHRRLLDPDLRIPLRHLARAFARVATGVGPERGPCPRRAAAAPGGGEGAVHGRRHAAASTRA